MFCIISRFWQNLLISFWIQLKSEGMILRLYSRWDVHTCYAFTLWTSYIEYIVWLGMYTKL
jgi:hypothetical protein